MFENYKEAYPPLNMDIYEQAAPISFRTSDFIPTTRMGVYWGRSDDGLMFPLWYTDYRDEALSWHLTCSIHTGLTPSPVTVVRGSEAIDFLRDNFVNNVDSWEVGRQKHGITLTEDGHLATHGLMMRTGEQEYELWWHAPYVDYLFSLKQWDAELIDVSMERFTFQLSGPESEAILEEACGESLANVEYLHFRNARIAGKDVRVLRFGMTGNLAFEVHGNLAEALDVYKSIMECGAPRGIRENGYLAYNMNHNEGGYPNAAGHFIPATLDDPGFIEWLHAGNDMEGGSYESIVEALNMRGSLGSTDPRDFMFNPIELGLGYCINWNHDFRGKQALLDYKASGKTRNIVTLEWNVDDVIDVYRSQFDKDNDAYQPLDDWSITAMKHGANRDVQAIIMNLDRVYDVDGNEIGLSMFTTHSPYYKCILSLAVLDDDKREVGSQVEVLWGDPDLRQKRMRATIVPFPYNKHHERKGISL